VYGVVKFSFPFSWLSSSLVGHAVPLLIILLSRKFPGLHVLLD
jgi:hypothetical protein